MARRYDAYALELGDNIGDPPVLNARWRDIDQRIDKIEADTVDLDATIAAITQVGLARLNDALAPVFAEVEAISDVGVMFTAHSVSDVSTGTGQKTFLLDSIDRGRFAAPAYLAVMNPDFTKAMLGSLVSYDRASGTLVINIDRSTGSGDGQDWTISASSATDNAEAAEEAAASAAAAAASVVDIATDVTIISNYLDNALAARNAAQTAQASAATSAAGAAASKTAADADAASATTAQTNAANSASAAAASASAAAASSTSAASHAADALTYDNAAAASAAAAATSASAGASSATAAASSASAAATSATGAAASKTAADADAAATAADRTAIVAAGTLYGQVWLGAFASDPVTDNVGGALVQGAAYLNTTSGYLKYYLASAWTNVVVPIGSSVTSAFGRTGAVTATTGDYNSGQVSRSAVGGVGGTTVEAALIDLKAQIDTKEASSAFGSFGLTLAAETSAANARTDLGLVIGTDVQAYDAELAALAGLTSAADRLPYFTGAGSASVAVFTATARSLVAGSSAGAMQTTLGLVPGTDVQAYDATLLSIAALGTAADKIAYTTAIDTWAETALTATGRSLIAGASASAMRTTLGVVPGTDVQAYDATLLSLATLGTGADKIAYTTGVDAWAEASLSTFMRGRLGDASASAARTGFGVAIGADVQAYSASLTSLDANAGSAANKMPYTTAAGTWTETSLTATGRSLIQQANNAAVVSLLSLTIGTNVQAYDATLTSMAALGTGSDKMAYTTGVDTWAEASITAAGRSLVAGANASAQRTTLGVAVGTDVQAYDATLTSIAALGTAADKVAYTTGTDVWAEAALTSFGRSIIAGTTQGAVRTTLALTPGTDVQAYDATLLSIAALGTAADKMLYTTGIDTWAETGITATSRTFLSGASTSAMRSTLGVAIGADVQAYAANLTTFAGIAPSANVQTMLAAADYAGVRTDLGLVIGTNVQAYDATLLSIAALGTAANKIAYTTGVDVWAESGLSAYQRKMLSLGLTSNTTVTGPTPNADTDAIYDLTAQAGAAAFANPSGTPVNGQPLRMRIKDNGTARALSFSSTSGGYRGGTDLPLPTTTVLGKTMYLLFFWNADDSKWDYAGQVGNI